MAASPSSATTVNPVAAGLGAGFGGILGSFLGGSLPTSTPYSSTIQNNSGTMFGQGQNTYSAGSGLLNQGTAQTPQTIAQTQAYVQALSQNPYTSNYSQAQMANANGNAAQNLAGGSAALYSRLSASGLAQPGGGPNSVLAGGQTALQQTALNSQDAARNQLAAQSYQQQLENLGLANQAQSGLQGMLIGQGNQTIGQGAGIENMSQQQLEQLAQSYLQQQQQNAGASSGIGGGLGSLVGLGLNTIPGI